MENKIDKSVAIILVVLFGVYGTLYTSRKGFWEIFAINIFLIPFGIVNLYILSTLVNVNVFTVWFSFNIFAILVNILWVLPIISLKKSSNAEFSICEIEQAGKTHLREIKIALKELNNFQMKGFISLLCGLILYAILTFFKIESETFKIVLSLILLWAIFIYLLLSKDKIIMTPKN